MDTGGLAIGTVVSSSGLLDVLGVVSNTLDYGREEIGSGGVAIGETVLAAPIADSAISSAASAF